MPFDLPKWMKEDMGFSEDEIKAATPLFTTDRVAKIEQSMLRQSDYSRQMNDLKTAQTSLKEADDSLNAQLAAWAESQANGEKQTKAQAKALEDAEAVALRLKQTVRTLATAAGQDPEKALEGIAVPDPKTTTTTAPATIDTSGFLTNEHGARLAQLSLALATTVPALANEHFELTGQRLDTEALGREILARIGTPGNKKSTDVRDVWIELHGITEKRTTAAQKKHDDEISEAVKRGRTEALSEVNLPGPHHIPGRPQSQVMAKFSGPEHKSAINRPAPGTTVNAAVSAFRTGKYRQGSAPVAPAGK